MNRITAFGFLFGVLLNCCILSAEESVKKYITDGRCQMIEKKYDVAVIGGNFRAVLSAVEAAKNGAEVYLIAPRPRLGDDIAGTLMLDAFTGDLPDWDKVGKKFVSGAEKALPHHFKLKQRGCDLPKAKLTPNYVKYTLDDMLIKNNVRFITSSFVSRII